MIRLALFFVAASLSTACANHDNHRIVGGHNTTIENHPYQVSVQYFGKQICGGAIVSDKYVITAAQCLPPKGTNPNFVIMRVGTNNRTRGGFSYETAEWYSFPMFKPATLDGDIGFYKTKNPMVFGPTVQAIQLISKLSECPQPGEMLVISGWGRNSLSSDSQPHILQEARIPKLPQNLCRMALSKTTKFLFSKGMLCAGGGVSRQMNIGDFGGPIVNANKKLVGIASGISPSESLGYPSVFTDISNESIREYITHILNKTFWEPDF